MALGGAVPEPQDPLLGVVPVVGDLLDGLRRQPRELAVPGRQPLVQQVLVDGEVELAGDGVGEVAVGLLDQLEVAEGPLLAEVGQLVLVTDEREQHPRLPQQVQGDVGEGHLLLQDGGVARPLPQPVREHQRVVAECEGGAHRCFTPSGIS